MMTAYGRHIRDEAGLVASCNPDRLDAVPNARMMAAAPMMRNALQACRQIFIEERGMSMAWLDAAITQAGGELDGPAD